MGTDDFLECGDLSPLFVGANGGSPWAQRPAPLRDNGVAS